MTVLVQAYHTVAGCIKAIAVSTASVFGHLVVADCLSKSHFEFWRMHTDKRVCVLSTCTWRILPVNKHANEHTVNCNSLLGLRVQRPFP